MAILLKFKETFRERVTEWILSIGLVLWGFVVISNPGLFVSQVFFTPLLAIMSQAVWGWCTGLIGIIRLVFLFINGGFRRSAHIRAIGAFLGTIVWSTLFFAALGYEPRATGIATFGVLLALDLFALWWATGDAKAADAKSVKSDKRGT